MKILKSMFACLVASSSIVQAINFVPVADTFIQRNKGTNFGKQPELLLKQEQSNNNNDRISLIRYDISEIELPVVGVGLTFTSTTLLNNAVTLNVFGIEQNCTVEKFSETNITYSANKGNLVNTSSAMYNSDVVTLLGSITIPAQTRTFVFSTDQLQNFVNADTNGVISFVLTRSKLSLSDVTKFASREHATQNPIILSLASGETLAEGMGAEAISPTSATFSAQLIKKSEEQADVYVVCGEKKGISIDSWEHVQKWENVSVSNLLTHTATDLTPCARYYWRVAVSNVADGVVWDKETYEIELPFPDGANDVVWTGEGNASNASNWRDSKRPTADSIVYLGHTSANNMIWDAGVDGLTDSVAGWVQTTDYSGSVTFATTYPDVAENVGFDVFTVTGDCTLSGGSWTQLSNLKLTNDTYRLCVDIGGDMNIGESGMITVSLKGRGVSTSTSVSGPGCNEFRAGASYAGSATKGDAGDRERVDQTYGSLFNPTRLGSGTQKYQGAGAILMTVGGNLIIDGLVAANGDGRSNNQGAASGGSILLRMKSLSGEGAISANGGNDKNHGYGSGGRIALYIRGEKETFDLFKGEITATCGYNQYDGGVYAGAGTIYKETSSDSDASGQFVVFAKDNTKGNAWTSLPAIQPLDAKEDFSQTKWFVKGYGIVKLTADEKIESMQLEGSNSKLYLNGKNLTLRQFTDKGNRAFSDYGTYTNNVNGYFNNVNFTDGGTITIPNPVSVVIIK